MKKAFTMLELIFVIVVIGILAAVIVPNTKRNPLQEAAVQVASHIKYTQHLAMTDDRYDADRIDADGDVMWYKERWQLVFSTHDESDNKVAYTVFSDRAGTGASRGDPSASEVALNPEDPNQLMTGGYSSGGNRLDIRHADFRGMKKLNIGKTYDVESVDFSNSCDGSNNTSTRIAFDHLGRPLHSDHNSMTGPYSAGTQRLLTSDCNITLSDGSENIVLNIKPETGFVCILNDDGNCQ